MLTDSQSDSVFLSSDWLTSWAGSVADHVRPFIVTAWDDHVLLAAAPFYIEPDALGLKSLHCMGHGYADFCNVVARREHGEAIQEVARAVLAHAREWDCLVLQNLPADCAFVRSLMELNGGGLWGLHEACGASPFLDVKPNWPDGLSAHFRQQLRRQRRRLEASQGAINLSVAVEPADVDRALSVFYELHFQRWVEMQGSVSNYAVAKVREWHSAMFVDLASRGLAAVFSLESGGTPVAVAVNLIYGGTMYYCQPAFDPAFARFSPSKLLVAELLDYCVTNGLSVFDFLRGDEAYKSEWTEKAVELSRLHVCRRYSARGRMLMQWHSRWREQLRAAPVVGKLIIRARWNLRRLHMSRRTNDP